MPRLTDSLPRRLPAVAPSSSSWQAVTWEFAHIRGIRVARFGTGNLTQSRPAVDGARCVQSSHNARTGAEVLAPNERNERDERNKRRFCIKSDERAERQRQDKRLKC